MRAGDYERDAESGLLLPRKTRQRGILHARPQWMGGPAFFGGATTDPYFSSVSLLLHMEGSNGSTTFTDSSSNAYTPTVTAPVTISTTQKKYGAASGSFSGAGKLTYTRVAPFDFGTGSFTFETWYYPLNAWGGSNNPVLMDGRISGPDGVTSFVLEYATDGTLLYYAGNAHRFPTSGGSAPTVNAWNHVAVCRDASTTTTRAFLNGTQNASWTADTLTLTTTPTIGNQYTGGSSTTSASGYLDEVRITKGVARYTANFTPPTAAFPNS